MKRTELRRKTPMSRTRFRQGKASTKRRKPLSQRGKVAKAWTAALPGFRAGILDTQGPRCGWPGCPRDWSDVHHVIGRGARPDLRMDETILIGLCAEHNQRCEGDLRTEARELGVRFSAYGEELEARASVRKIRKLDTTEETT